jgi:hypothetical protein
MFSIANMVLNANPVAIKNSKGNECLRIRAKEAKGFIIFVASVAVPDHMVDVQQRVLENITLTTRSPFEYF